MPGQFLQGDALAWDRYFEAYVCGPVIVPVNSIPTIGVRMMMKQIRKGIIFTYRTRIFVL